MHMSCSKDNSKQPPKGRTCAARPWQFPALDFQKSGPLIVAAARPWQPPALDFQKRVEETLRSVPNRASVQFGAL